MSELAWKNEFANQIDKSRIPNYWDLCVDTNLVKEDRGCVYTQLTFGSFHCPCCSRSWSSSKVFVLFLLNLNKRQGRGTVKMRIFKQGCEKCFLPEGNPTMTAENIARVVSNLVNKIQRKFYEVNDKYQDKKPKIYGTLEGAHNMERCEACRYGLCEQQLPPTEHGGSSTSSSLTAMGLVMGIGSIALLYFANK